MELRLLWMAVRLAFSRCRGMYAGACSTALWHPQIRTMDEPACASQPEMAQVQQSKVMEAGVVKLTDSTLQTIVPSGISPMGLMLPMVRVAFLPAYTNCSRAGR